MNYADLEIAKNVKSAPPIIGAIYARASTGKQGETVENQVAMIKEYVKRTDMNVEFPDRFIFIDEAKSGFKTTLLQRPEMNDLLKAVNSGIVKIVFFKGISRFARDSSESIYTAQHFNDLGVRVVSLEENYDSQVNDPLMFQLHAVMAENESRKTSIRVSLANKQKARDGIYPNSTLPIGYQRVKNIKDEEEKQKALQSGLKPMSLYPDENAEIVRQIFNMYVNENLGRKRITNWLNQNGYKTARGNDFQEKSIIGILLNPAYAGDVVYGITQYKYIPTPDRSKKIQKTVKVDREDWAMCANAHPPIIDRELFEKAQLKFNENEFKLKNSGAFNSARHPLTGIMFCAKCGKPMMCQKRTNTRADGTKLHYRYYVCSTYHKKGRHICDQANVKADDVEETIYEEIKLEAEKIKAKIDEVVKNKLEGNNSKEKEIEASIANIEMKMNECKEGLKNLYKNIKKFSTDMFDEMNESFTQELEDLRTQKESLEESLSSINNHKSVIDFEKMYKEYIESKIDDLASLRHSFHQWIDKVIIEDKVIKCIKFKYSID